VYRAAVSAGALVRVHPEVTLVQGAWGRPARDGPRDAGPAVSRRTWPRP